MRLVTQFSWPGTELLVSHKFLACTMKTYSCSLSGVPRAFAMSLSVAIVVTCTMSTNGLMVSVLQFALLQAENPGPFSIFYYTRWTFCRIPQICTLEAWVPQAEHGLLQSHHLGFVSHTHILLRLLSFICSLHLCLPLPSF